MDKELVKRNYNYIVYNILKDRTSKDGVHLSAPAICRIIAEEYGVKMPDRKTIYQFQKDFSSFGYDVQIDRKGFYLGERVLSEAELQILIDGIESLNGLSVNDKIGIYEKLCAVVGRDPATIDNYLYKYEIDYTMEDDKDTFPEDEPKKSLEVIYTAMKNGKQIVINDVLLPFFKIILAELTAEEKEYFINLRRERLCQYNVNPYKVFRNADNALELLFYINAMGKTYMGVYNIAIAFKDGIQASDLPMDKTDKDELLKMFNSLDLNNFKGVSEYLEGEALKTAEIVVKPEGLEIGWWMFVDSVTDLCEKHYESEIDGAKVYTIIYKQKKEKAIIDECVNNCDILTVNKGSDLYRTIIRMKNELNYTYGK